MCSVLFPGPADDQIFFHLSDVSVWLKSDEFLLNLLMQLLNKCETMNMWSFKRWRLKTGFKPVSVTVCGCYWWKVPRVSWERPHNYGALISHTPSLSCWSRGKQVLEPPIGTRNQSSSRPQLSSLFHSWSLLLWLNMTPQDRRCSIWTINILKLVHWAAAICYF